MRGKRRGGEQPLQQAAHGSLEAESVVSRSASATGDGTITVVVDLLLLL